MAPLLANIAVLIVPHLMRIIVDSEPTLSMAQTSPLLPLKNF